MCGLTMRKSGNGRMIVVLPSAGIFSIDYNLLEK